MSEEMYWLIFMEGLKIFCVAVFGAIFVKILILLEKILDKYNK